MSLKFLCAVLLSAIPALALTVPFDCGRGIPLQEAINFSFPDETLLLSGSCTGPVVITRNLTLAGRTGTTLNGSHKDAVTVNGPARVTIKNLEIQGGVNGIHGLSAAQLNIINTNIHGNTNMGILLEGNSSATLSGTTTSQNGVNGIDAEASSAVIISGTYLSESNGVFGMNINGASSLTLNTAQVTIDHNILGLQIGTSASAFIADPATVLTVKNNVTTGLTIVSGAHMVDFGGVITATGNGVHGVSIDSKAGLDLDAAGSLTSTGNGQDGVHLEETSVLTIFNTTAFSGAPGMTTLTAQSNGNNGVSVLTSSNLTVIHQAAIYSRQNVGFGIQVDNGSSLTLIQSNVTGNKKDLVLTFGSRADVSQMTTVGTLSCDATVLLRGDVGLHCP